MALRMNRRIIPITANLTLDVTKHRCGTRFTNRGAVGAVTLTLPTLPSGATGAGPAEWVGYWVEFQGVADQSITVAAAAGKAVCFNNAAATSLAASTGGQKIGALIKATWDGSSWQMTGEAAAVTYTVA